MSVPLRVLIIEDSEEDALLVLHELHRGGFEPVVSLRIETDAEMRAALARPSWDVILADYTLPHFSAPAALAVQQASGLDIPFIVVSGTVREEDALAMMRRGAQDFILKDNLARLTQTIYRELREAEVRRQRRETEALLRRERDRAQQYLDIAGVMILALDPDGRITLINQRGHQLLGYAAEELIGKDWYEVAIPPHRRQDVRADFQRILSGDVATVEYHEHSVMTRHGEERVIAFRSTAVRDDGDRIIGTLSSGEDITDRQRAQQALERERAFLSSAIEFLPFPILFLTAPQGELLRANQASYRFFRGMEPSTWWNVTLLTPETRRPIDREEWPVMRAARGEVVSGFETIIVLPNGRETPIIAFASPIHVGGHFVASVVAFQDITALKEIDRAKDQFLAILSHELRTPLTNILGWAKEAIVVPQLAAQALQVIRRNAEIQRRMLENLLEATRLIHGKLALSREPLALWRLAEQVVEEMRSLAEERRISVTLVAPDTPLPVLADRKRMQEVIANLLENAIKFTPPGGRVTITGERQGAQASLSVRDTGRGIAAEEMLTLFELFRTAPQADAAQGLHLGLAVVKRIMELHGGSVAVSSPGPEHGSTFTIMLPLVEDT